MRTPVRAVLLAGALLCAAALIVLLWPLSATGVEGTALWPHYVPFGWTTYHALPAHPTAVELRQAGIPQPHTTVAHLRHIAEVLGGIGIAVLALGALGRATERSHVGV